jgi:ornithine carbamoyltransferase
LRHFISIAEHPPDTLRGLLDVAKQLKAEFQRDGRNRPLLAGKTLAMIFEKPSLRTRVSFASAMTQLGGAGLLLRDEEVGLGKREPVRDVARVLSGMVDGIMARTFEHHKVVELATHSAVPVINGLTDFSHPCQAMADLMTVEEHFSRLPGLVLAYIGDANNVARSLGTACAKLGIEFRVACPEGYGFAEPFDDGGVNPLAMTEFRDPEKAVAGADVIYTDTWVSMGQEREKQKRVRDFAGFCVDESLLSHAPPHAVVLHCLPAYRGLEISEGVMESPASLVFQQAHNRLHVQKGLLACLMSSENLG